MVSVPARRAQVAFATGRGLSQRRACTLVKVARSALHYRSLKAERDAPVIRRMHELSALYPRYGYRRIRIFLGRDGHKMSPERAHRLWRQAKLQVPRKRPRRRVANSRPRPNAPNGANHVWAIDFIFDTCANGQKLKCLTVADEWTKECLSLEWFRSRAEAKVVIEIWRRHYNEVRPHSSLSYLTPAAFAATARGQDAASGHATGRSAAVHGASALRPVAQPLCKGQPNEDRRASFSN